MHREQAWHQEEHHDWEGRNRPQNLSLEFPTRARSHQTTTFFKKKKIYYYYFFNDLAAKNMR